MAKPPHRTHVKVVTAGLSAKSAKAVKTLLRKAIEKDLESAGPHPTSGFPKQTTIVASTFTKGPSVTSRGRGSSRNR